MKKLLAALCALCLLPLSACGANGASKGGAAVGLANPFVDYATLGEAEKAAGFTLSAPERIDGFDPPSVQLMSGKMLQLIYRSGDQRLIVRKAAGGDDISGDYNSCAETKSVRINGADVSFRGADGAVSTAVWCAKGYSYAVLSDTPLATDILMDLIAEIA